MKSNQNQHVDFTNTHSEDFSVLNYLLEHVRGLSPSSLTPEIAYDDSLEMY